MLFLSKEMIQFYWDVSKRNTTQLSWDGENIIYVSILKKKQRSHDSIFPLNILYLIGINFKKLFDFVN